MGRKVFFSFDYDADYMQLQCPDKRNACLAAKQRAEDATVQAATADAAVGGEEAEVEEAVTA